MSVGRVMFLVGLLGVALGLSSMTASSDAGAIFRVSAFGAILVFFVISYLWWRLLGIFARLGLLAVVLGASVLLLMRVGPL